MKKLIGSFKKVFIHKDSAESQVAKNLLALFPSNKIEIVTGSPDSGQSGDLSACEFNESKRNIFVVPYRGKFFKRCPGFKPGLSCCNYFVLNLGLQCNMNCSYCYLQSYLNTPLLTIYSNIEDALHEIRDLASSYPNLPYRIGTGETIDSLSLDPLTLYSHPLIATMREIPHWQLEFKTKSNNVEQFLEVPHAGNIIVSWSINPDYVVQREEHGTATTQERLHAAERCRERGFKVAFHMDPIIWHPEWQQNYGELIDDICQRFDPALMPPVTLGTLRFQPEQRHMMRERFGFNSLVTTAEMHRCRDGKLRYDSDLRNQMFQFIIRRFANHDPKWRVSLCMETPESWLKSFNQSPRNVNGLGDFFRPIPTNKASQHLVPTCP